MLDLTQLRWMLRGSCSTLQANPEIFYEEGNEETAKAFCQLCPVVRTCLDWAMNNDEYGVWGGTSRADRKAVVRGGRRMSCPACSAQAIYQQPTEQICLACGMSWQSAALKL